MTRLEQRINAIAELAATLTPHLTTIAERLTVADGWIARGYPSGSSDGGRSADRSSSTERAALTPDTLAPRIAAIHDHIDQALTALRALHADHAWLQPTTIDPELPTKTATCLACSRVVAGIPDTRNRDGVTIRLGDPLKAGRCRTCHAAWLASRRHHPTNTAHRDPLTGRLAPAGLRAVPDPTNP